MQMTKRNTRFVTVWQGDPKRVSLASDYDSICRLGRLNRVATLPLSEFEGDTGLEHQDEWSAVKAISKFAYDVLDATYGWYLTCAPQGDHENPDWTFAFVSPDAYDAMQEKGKNPAIINLGDDMICMQCTL